MAPPLRFLWEHVLGQPLLAARNPRPRPEKNLPAVPSPAEMRRMLDQVHHPKHRALVMLAYSAGLRVGELVRLRPADLDVERGLLHVRRGKGERTESSVVCVPGCCPSAAWRKAGERPG